jgi:hypothetical protein
MRGVLVLALFALLGAGCVSSQSLRPRGLARQRLLTVPQGPDVVQLEVALVERRLGDAYINKALWVMTEEQVAGIDRLTLLENNGFRVGQVIGSLPSELQRMLKNERFCCNARAYYLRAGSSQAIALGLTVPTCTFQLKHEDLVDPVTEEQAQCELLIEPSLTADGKTRLRFTPQVKYGEAMTTIEAAPESSSWEIQVKKPCHSYPEVSWEVTLAPNEWLVIGTHLGQTQSLGYQSFVNEEGATPIQRLLVLRTNRGPTRNDSDGDVPTTAGQAMKSGRR